MKRTLACFADIAQGVLHGADRSFGEVASDTRKLSGGELFVALSGPNFDGHDFVAAAAGCGAVGAVVSRASPAVVSQIIVDDPLRALQRAAARWRAGHVLAVVGVAGSNGKTTTKEMVAGILSQCGPCLSTRGNLNNHIGVPLTLMRLAPEHRTAVIEMGANARGDLRQLSPWVRPDVALVTNAGAEHLEGFIDLDGVAAGEGELFEALGPEGTAVVNADDAYAGYWSRVSSGGRLVTFGHSAQADFRAREVRARITPEGFRQEFTLLTPAGSCEVSLALGGAHNVLNALGAAAAACAAGATLAHVRAGLAVVRPVAGRLEPKRALGGAWLLDDSYNANPSSLKAACDVMAGVDGEKWLVLGDMGELGAGTVDFHTEAGDLARAAGFSRLYAIGGLARHAVASFGVGAEWFESAQALAARVAPLMRPGLSVLVKGSRVNRLERVVDALARPPVVE